MLSEVLVALAALSACCSFVAHCLLREARRDAAAVRAQIAHVFRPEFVHAQVCYDASCSYMLLQRFVWRSLQP